jgi:hypothetical protein
MKKLFVVALASLGLLAAVPQVAGAATLAQRVNTLEGKVANLQAKTNCLVRYGLSEWTGYAPYVGGDGTYAYDPYYEDVAANLDLAFGDTSPPDVWVVAVRNTSTCRGKFARGADPYGGFALSARPSSAKAAQIERAFPR